MSLDYPPKQTHTLKVVSVPVFVTEFVSLHLCVKWLRVRGGEHARLCGCVFVCEDLPEDSSHAPLISTATC